MSWPTNKILKITFNELLTQIYLTCTCGIYCYKKDKYYLPFYQIMKGADKFVVGDIWVFSFSSSLCLLVCFSVSIAVLLFLSLFLSLHQKGKWQLSTFPIRFYTIYSLNSAEAKVVYPISIFLQKQQILYD